MRTFLGLAALCAAAFATMPASAALPPEYQRIAELRAVLAHPGVTAAFGGAPIDRLEYVRNNLYRVSAGRCHVDVALVGLPNPQRRVGAWRFEARPGKRVCAGRGGRR